MKFPKQELNIDEYLDNIKNLLQNGDCHIFIDTNVISQLYRLNDKARIDFYTWVASIKDRFHIPNWSVHEYSKRVTSKNTKDYLEELSKAKTYSKEFRNISRFIKGYVGESMLTGTEYSGNRGQLFTDVDQVNTLFERIATAINTKLEKHQQSVHTEVLDKLEQYTLDSDIYDILSNLQVEREVRFDSKIPPGFKDSGKDDDGIGDLIIWKEILAYCKSQGLLEDKAKVIFISRDVKTDMVYRPPMQTRDGHSVKDDDKIEIAHESLVYEFKTKTKSEDFYLISFYTLVKVLASNFRELAISFQIATEQEHNESIEEDCPDSIDVINIIDSPTTLEPIAIEPSEPAQILPENIDAAPDAKYSESAIQDYLYDAREGLLFVNECIEGLKTYNWYKQNPAIDKLYSIQISAVENSQQNRDSFFVLGRNMLQAADGSSGSAISFIEGLSRAINNWPTYLKEAFIDGCLFEVFFDSYGRLRQNGFKSTYFEDVVRQANISRLNEPFTFINQWLQTNKEDSFVPIVGDNSRYNIVLTIKESDLPFVGEEIVSLKINGQEVSNRANLKLNGVKDENITMALSYYYAIPLENIDLTVTK